MAEKGEVGRSLGVSRAMDHKHLVAVVPPGHHARILWRVVAQPPVGLAVVVDHHFLAIVQLSLEHDLWLREAFRQPVRILVEFLTVGNGTGHQVDAQRETERKRHWVVVHLHEQAARAGRRGRGVPLEGGWSSRRSLPRRRCAHQSCQVHAHDGEPRPRHQLRASSQPPCPSFGASWP